ncbi:MAG TPA: hypothetical protein VIZ28_07645 [Chitinophagaceae bacterium]
MENLNFHKQKLYSLIIAGVALIAMILPWASFSLGIFGGDSVNGFRSWGILSLFGVIGVAIACLLGDKSKEFDETFKKVALGSFGAIALGALLFFFRINSYGGGFGGVGSGLGLWLCLVAGLAGLGWVSGLVKLPDNKKPPSPPQQ